MTLRITAVASPPPGSLCLQGRLGAAEVEALLASVAGGARVLDLRDLVSADEAGLAALRRLRERGVELRNASHYLAMRLG